MDLSLITCNIRFDNPADGPNSWPHRRSFLSEILLTHNPHIIATQEGRFEQLKELESLLPGFEMIDQHRSWIGERMYPTFFYKTSAFEFLGSGDHWLSETPDVAGSLSFSSAFPRLMTWTRVQVKGTALKIMLVNTHLDHIRLETRQYQVKVLTQEIKRNWSCECPLIIMGDFNEGPGGLVRKVLDKEFDLVDSWKTFNSDEETSHHPFTGVAKDGARIDWILTDKKLLLRNCFMEKSNRQGLWPTDHFPVVCSLSV